MKVKALFVLLFAVKGFLFAEEARLLRFPSVSQTNIVFSYGGDLYQVERKGGVASRLTSHKGYEMFAKYSPDGQTIAFTGQYDGNTEVYQIPSTGGEPQRLSFTATLGRDEIDDRMGPNNIVMAWKNNEEVIFRSRQYSFNAFIGQLFTVNKKGGELTTLPFEPGSWISYHSDEKKAAYNEIFREFRAWKNYRGGMADDIFVHDFETNTTENITKTKAQDICPMWYKNEVYFISDRDRRMNLYAYDVNTKTITQKTHFTEFDIKFPSIGGDAIVYENAGYVYLYDLKKGENKRVEISLPSDLPFARTKYVDASNFVQAFSLSPKGKRVCLTARGEVFNIPVEKGVTYNYSRTSGVHEREGTWAPDGKSMAYFSDKSGSYEVYQYDVAKNEEIQLTKKTACYKSGLIWAPNSEKLLYTNRKSELVVLDIASKKERVIAKTKDGAFRYYAWHPESNWVTYTQPAQDAVTRIHIYDLTNEKDYTVTDEWFDARDAHFSTDGKLLYFVSDRSFNPSYSHTEWNHAYFDLAKMYCTVLDPSGDNPIALKNEREILGDTTKPSSSYHLENLAERTFEIPTPKGNYSKLATSEKGLYYLYSKQGVATKLKYYVFEEKKEHEIGKIRNFEISADGKKMMLYKSSKDISVVALPKKAVTKTKKIDLAGMKVSINLKEEWEEIYKEAHRQFGELFYAENMHGFDWESLGKQYEPLVKHVAHRSDLTYIISELISELNVGHAYVGKGDVPKAQRINLGLLGATYERDKKTGYFKIVKILESDHWSKSKSAAINRLNQQVKEGDYIIAINGVDANEYASVQEALIGQAGRTVELAINNEAKKDGAHTILVEPMKDEANLYYNNWVQANIKKVNEATNGQVGYVHIPNMISHGLNEFVQHYYPQLHKKALIIDDRGNGGGNVSQQIIERLNRELLLSNYSRGQNPGRNPYNMHLGPKVLLIDQYSASDGDLFAFRFKQLKMGPVIGRRTWGGVVGYYGKYQLVDNGFVVIPQFAHYGVNGEGWVIEGVGVNPTIEVKNNAIDEFNGKDDQLEKAIETALKELENFNQQVPPVPPYPDKSK